MSNFAIDTLQDVENAAIKLRNAWELGLTPMPARI